MTVKDVGEPDEAGVAVGVVFAPGPLQAARITIRNITRQKLLILRAKLPAAYIFTDVPDIRIATSPSRYNIR
jgi:hypothetical protein